MQRKVESMPWAGSLGYTVNNLQIRSKECSSVGRKEDKAQRNDHTGLFSEYVHIGSAQPDVCRHIYRLTQPTSVMWNQLTSGGCFMFSFFICPHSSIWRHQFLNQASREKALTIRSSSILHRTSQSLLK